MTTTTSRYASADQARMPSGTPVGGQFSTQPRMVPEVAIRELSDAEYNADGSYTFPPSPRSAAQHIAFWESVPLPESMLAATMTEYAKMREEIGVKAAEAAVAKWKESNPDPTRYANDKWAIRDGEKWSADARAVHRAAFDAAVADMPRKIFRTSARPLLRAHQMFGYGASLIAAERAIVLAHEVVVDGKAMTVQQVEDTYHLSRIRPNIT